MSEEKKQATVPFMFKLVSMSPDPQNKTMRTNLEPANEDFSLIRVDIPLTGEFIANADKVITAQLSAGDVPKAILTPAGLAEIYRQFSNAYIPEVEEVSEEEWEDDGDDWSEDDTSNDEEWEDDEDWEE